MAKYFVTGATGFIGGEIVKQLIGRGHKVAALVRSPERAGILKALGVEIHPGDITDRETLITPMTGVDGVFHVAAWYKVGVKEPLAEQINVEGTRNVLHTMRAVLRDVHMREQAGVIQKEVGVLLDDTRRLDERVDNLQKHFDQATRDVRDIRISTDKVIKRAAQISNVELEGNGAPSVPLAPPK